MLPWELKEVQTTGSVRTRRGTRTTWLTHRQPLRRARRSLSSGFQSWNSSVSSRGKLHLLNMRLARAASDSASGYRMFSSLPWSPSERRHDASLTPRDRREMCSVWTQTGCGEGECCVKEVRNQLKGTRF